MIRFEAVVVLVLSEAVLSAAVLVLESRRKKIYDSSALTTVQAVIF